MVIGTKKLKERRSTGRVASADRADAGRTRPERQDYPGTENAARRIADLEREVKQREQSREHSSLKERLAQNAQHKDWACTEELMKTTKDGKALYLHCLPVIDTAAYVFVLLFSWQILKEKISRGKIIGNLIIILGILVYTL